MSSFVTLIVLKVPKPRLVSQIITSKHQIVKSKCCIVVPAGHGALTNQTKPNPFHRIINLSNKSPVVNNGSRTSRAIVSYDCETLHLTYKTNSD